MDCSDTTSQSTQEKQKQGSSFVGVLAWSWLRLAANKSCDSRYLVDNTEYPANNGDWGRVDRHH